jgi:hypothetical protein
MGGHDPNPEPPDRRRGDAARDEARRLFQRTLAGWASDLLELQRTGVVHPSVPGDPDDHEKRRRRKAA